MIEGQVAAIINERELAINRGSDHGVERGMKFEVLEKRPVPITDPETQQELGSVTIVKIRVRVADVEPQWSIAETYEVIGGKTSLAFLMGMEAGHVRTLRTDEAITKPLSEQESYVKRGDPVRQIGEVSAPMKTPDLGPITEGQ